MNTKRSAKITALLLALMLAVAIAFSGCVPKKADNRTGSSSDAVSGIVQVQEVSFRLTITQNDGTKLFDGVISGRQDDTLAEALQSALGEKFVAESGSMGLYVTEFCGVAGSTEDKTYWALYVNGEYAMAGVSDYVLGGSGQNAIQQDDLVEFRLESYE